MVTARLGPLPPIRALQTRAGRLSYILSGRGEPAILLFNGAGVTLQGWAALYPAIERCGTVFGWNRCGVQGSDAPRRRQTGAAVLAALRELLGYAAVQPPYLLVGHSLGGLYANLFARLHPGETAGVLFVEATHPADRDVLRRHEAQLVRALARVIDLPQAFFRRNVRSELACVDDVAREIEAAGAFPPVPVRVVTGGRAPPAWLMSPAAVGARRAHQQLLARLSPLGTQVIAQRSGHFPQLTEPGVVLAALRELAALRVTAVPAP
jgi:pimeloyl-ACP methyl ester carboxylesterase